MTCKTCGARCQGRYCVDCGRDDHRDQLLDTDDNTETDTKTLPYECSDCHEIRYSEGPGQCPHCGSYFARYAGEEACA